MHVPHPNACVSPGLVIRTERRMMLKLRGGTAAFQIEMGRWHGVKREDRICKECDSGPGRLRMCVIGYCSALRGIITDSLS